jgi:uncharacterized membrane protein
MIDFGWLVRSIHILAAAVWVGGSFMYLVVIIPALRNAGAAPGVFSQVAILFKRMVNYCVGILLLSGTYLTFDRLTQTTLGFLYLIVLGLKIVAATSMFVLALYLGQSDIRRLAKRSTHLSKVAPKLLLALGILVFILGAFLNHLFEIAIAPH